MDATKIWHDDAGSGWQVRSATLARSPLKRHLRIAYS